MSRKKIGLVLIALLLVLAIVPLQVSASPGRLSALGLNNGTSWMLSLDEGYFFLNPAAIQQLRPQVWADLTATQAGLLLGLGNNFNLYVLTGFPIAITFGGIPATAIVDPGQELIRAGVGFNIGKVNVGISSFVAGAAYSNATNNHKDLILGVNGGAYIPLSANMTVDAAAGITYWDIERHFTPANDYVAQPLDFNALGRLSIALAQSNTLHIYGQFVSTNRGYTFPTGTTVANTNTGFTAGAADQMELGTNVMVFAGAYGTANRNSVAAGNTDTASYVANAGSEITLSNAVTARIGLQHVLAGVTYVSATNTTSQTGGGTTLSGGFGLNQGNLSVDAELSIPLLTIGPNFISGAYAAAWTADLSVTYYFAAAK